MGMRLIALALTGAFVWTGCASAVNSIDDLARATKTLAGAIRAKLPETGPLRNRITDVAEDIAKWRKEDPDKTRSVMCEVLKETAKNGRVPDEDTMLRALVRGSLSNDQVTTQKVRELVNDLRTAQKSDTLHYYAAVSAFCGLSRAAESAGTS